MPGRAPRRGAQPRLCLLVVLVLVPLLQWLSLGPRVLVLVLVLVPLLDQRWLLGSAHWDSGVRQGAPRRPLSMSMSRGFSCALAAASSACPTLSPPR